MDAAHKIVSPSTYDCQLCKLTHGNLGKRKSWKSFLERSDHEMIFYHKDEFEARFSERFEYPVILFKRYQKLQILFDKEAISIMVSENELIKNIQEIQ